MSKRDNQYKQGTRLKIIIGDLPNYPFINRPQNIETHEYLTPPIPHHTDILYSDLPKKEQFWKRIIYPKLFYDFIPGVTEIEDEKELNLLMDCVTMDKMRRLHGLWIMVNGVPTYLTGNNYYFLQWGDLLNGEVDSEGNSYPAYREFQRDIFYFVDLCEKDENCLGGNFAKCKKIGVTEILASVYANEGTLYERYRQGVMSKTGQEVIDTNMAMIFHKIDRMPQIILPKVGKRSVMEISFSHPQQKPTGTKQYFDKIQELKEQKVLNSIIVAKNTKVGGFDGPKYNRIWFDEQVKYYQSVKISPKELFDKDSAAVKLQQKIIGKIWITNYTPEVDDQGFFEGKTIYYESKKITIDKNSILKRTKSGMYCYHISALYATEGTFNIYGQPDIEKAFRLNDEERRSAIGDQNKYQALVRQGARNEDESWMVGGSGSLFNNTRLQQSISDKEKRTFLNQPYYVRGNLEWEGAKFASYLKFIPNPNGRWYFTRSLKDEMVNTFSVSDSGGKLIITTNPTVNFVSGNDPFSYMDVSIDGTIGGSKGSTHFMSLPNMAMDEYVKRFDPNDIFSKRLIGWHCERPADPNDYFEDIVKSILYLNLRILIENNKEWLTKKIKDLGLREFLLFKNMDNGLIEKFNPRHNQKEKTTQKNDVDEIARVIDEYLSGKDPDYCFMLEDTELASQLMSFNPLNTKPFHKVMSFGYTLIALNSFSVTKKVLTTPAGLDMRKAAFALMH